MSYKALYRTYRPINFKEVMGQEHIVLTLQNIISQKKIGHAYLFAGPRGTGKTSVALIFAKAVNQIEETNASSEELDIIEIDAASHNGVAEVRNIISNVNYAPSKGKYKVYIIDEVHMLTKGAFNALLKTLEEPPEHVIFIFATTEPHKIPITILSRTQRFNFRRIEESIIGKQLRNVLEKENISFDEESIKFISKLSQGSLRDALSIVDQASAFGNNNVNFESISQVFGIISIENQIKLLNSAFFGDSKLLMTLINKFLDNGIDIERLTTSLLEIIKDYIIFKKTSDINLISFLSKNELDTIKIDIDFAYSSLKIFMDLLTNLRYTLIPRQLIELSMLKILKKPSNENATEEKETLEEIDSNKTLEETNIFDQEENQSINLSEKEKEKMENLFEKHFGDEKLDKSINKEEITNEETPQEEDIESLEEKSTKEQNLQLFEINENLETNKELKLDKEVNLNKELESKKEEKLEETPNKQNENLKVTNLEEKKEAESSKTLELLSKNEKFSQEEKEEDEEDIMKLFDNELDSVETQEINKENVVNLFIQAKRDEIEKDKLNWNKVQNHISNDKFKMFVELLIKTKIISSGEKFLLLSSEEEYVLDGINIERKNEDFIKFINKILGKPKLIFAINKDMFEEAKNEWQTLKDEDNLPSPKEILVPKVNLDSKTIEEKVGEELFNEVFSIGED